jgi:hypothetical protein
MNLDVESLVEHNGWLYIKHVVSHWTKPERTSLYWPLKVRFSEFAHRFGTEEEARQFLGCQVKHLGQGVFRDSIKFWSYRLVDGAQTKAEFVETEEVPEPKQRGKRCPIEWRQGQWYKELARGWVIA